MKTIDAEYIYKVSLWDQAVFLFTALVQKTFQLAFYDGTEEKKFFARHAETKSLEILALKGFRFCSH